MKSVFSKHIRWWLYISHRWLGIATCLLCAMWFVSGVVMMYVPYPRVTDRERLALLSDLDLSRLAITPDAAMRTANLTYFPASLHLAMLLGEPVYRIVEGGKRSTISAVDGRVIDNVDASMALRIVRAATSGRVPPTQPVPTGEEGAPELPRPAVETLIHDQWTVAQGFNPHRPLHKISLNDEAGTELYVSSHTGEIVQDTTRRERFWNWLGAVPHWLYPTVLRQDGEAWRQVVLWTSGPATIGAIAGLWVGILRLRMRHRYRGGRVSPYRGWMKWHHVAGIVAGLFLTTWLWSGWLSVNPFRWFDRTQTPQAALRAYAAHEKPTFGVDVSVLGALPSGSRDARLQWFDGRPLIVTRDAKAIEQVFDARSGLPVTLAEADIAKAAARLVPDAPMTGVTLLTEEDAYWYSHHNERRLPVLRATFGDEAGTWIHIDPVTGDVLGRSNSSARTYRWLFNALHDFDLRVLLRNRPMWDIVVIALSIAGLIISVSGIVIGWRRLGRKFAA